MSLNIFRKNKFESSHDTFCVTISLTVIFLSLCYMKKMAYLYSQWHPKLMKNNSEKLTSQIKSQSSEIVRAFRTKIGNLMVLSVC